MGEKKSCAPTQTPVITVASETNVETNKKKGWILFCYLLSGTIIAFLWMYNNMFWYLEVMVNVMVKAQIISPAHCQPLAPPSQAVRHFLIALLGSVASQFRALHLTFNALLLPQ